ncbi:MAG: RidA family protein [Chloroflexi bacterium]|nr:MAG: RidA family protein [Chloroflexota bacterium]
MVENFNPPALGPAVGFSHASRAGGFVFLGGQVGSDETGHIAEPGDIAQQFARAIRNVGTALEAAGSTPGQAVKLTYYVTDVTAYRRGLKAIGAAYREVFGKHFPATSLFGVKELFDPDALVEIECVALVGGA